MTDTSSAMRGFEKSLPIALLRAREATMRRFKPHLDASNLTVQQWRVMRALADHGALDASTLSERCVIMAPSLTRIFKTMTAKGLVAQVEDRDGRRHMVELTNSGRHLYAHIAATSESIYRELESAYGRREMETLMALLTRLREVAQDLPPPPGAPGQTSVG